MKKQKLLILISSLFLLMGCNVPTTDNGGAETIYEEGYFYAKVMYPNGNPVTGTEVRWCEGEMCYRPIPVDKNGVARIEEKDVTYNVHLTLPDGINYTYDPSKYTQNSSNKILEITLEPISEITNGNGEAYSTFTEQGEVGGPYHIKEGTYRTNIKSNKKEDIQYYRFTPSKPGNYVIESWVETIELTDPTVGNYGNSPSFLFYSDGDDESGEGHNFRYEFEVLPDNFEIEFYYDENDNVQARLDSEGHPILKTDANGNYIPMASYTFGMSSNNAFSVTYDFNLSFASEYVYPVYTIDEAEVKASLTKFNDSQFELIDIDLTGNDEVVFNAADGYYHLNDENGPVIVVHISSASKYIDNPFSTIEQNTGTAALTVCQGTKTYVKFVEQYARYCNSDGVYPLNEELITFLKELAEARMYFGSFGWISGSISESMGDTPYSLNSASDYLYACAYYKNDGDIDNPRIITVNKDSVQTVVVDINENFYYKFVSKNDVQITLTPDENTVIHYGENDYTNSSALVIDANKGEEYNFYIYRNDHIKGSASFSVILPPISERIVMGVNEIEATFTGVEITLTNNDVISHTYHIYSDDTNCLLVNAHNTNYVGGSANNGFTVTISAGSSYTFHVCTYDFVNFDTLVTFVIEAI